MHIFGFEKHKNRSPWDDAPPWAIELGLMLSIIIRQQETNIMDLNELQTAVAAEDTVIDSAILLIQGIPALIAAAGTDPQKLAQLQADIVGKTASLAAAVANVPAAPAPTTTPAPAPAPAPAPDPAPSTTPAPDPTVVAAPPVTPPATA